MAENTGWPNFTWPIWSEWGYGIVNPETQEYTEVIDSNGNVLAGTTEIVDWSVTTAKIDDDAVTNSEISDNAISLEHFDSWVTPSHIVVYAGEVTWSGWWATLAETVSGVLATDIVIASIHTLGTEGTILQWAYASATDTITFTLDAANTSNDAVISYQVLRAVS